jgi:NhaA family Na+:H+ antiporter
MTQKNAPMATKGWVLTHLMQRFLLSESKSGIILISCTLLSLLLANSMFGESYQAIWHSKIAGFSVEHLINDGLMAIFFLLVGLEIEREIYIGELSNLKAAVLPIFAALGGMLCPALIHWLFNQGTITQDGAGIPMATDIAFALGVLMLLGKRIPVSLKIFLTALAIIDDLGAIVVIALFYSKGIAWNYLGGAVGIFIILAIFNRLKIYLLWPYLLLGAVSWYCMLHSGIHATITGVVWRRPFPVLPFRT